MIRTFLSSCCALVAICLACVASQSAQAQVAYGVNAAGTLFSFEVTSPDSVSTHGSLSFIPEGIDFRPGTKTLYAIDIGPNTSQLYTINLSNGASTPVGAAFNSTGTVNAVNYNLTGNNTYGFDFNPTTLQADTSMRIRLVGSNGTNLRLHSGTGQIAAVDVALSINPSGASPFLDAAAYINNVPTAGGTTVLYDMDVRNNSLFIQNPPNNGTLTLVGPFGASITNAQSNIGFDIYTDPTNSDAGIGGDSAFAVLKRPDAPVNGVLGSYMLYSVNLTSGNILNGKVVGPAAAPFDFEGGFALLPVPEPTSCALALAACAMLVRRRRATR